MTVLTSGGAVNLNKPKLDESVAKMRLCAKSVCLWVLVVIRASTAKVKSAKWSSGLVNSLSGCLILHTQTLDDIIGKDEDDLVVGRQNDLAPNLIESSSISTRNGSSDANGTIPVPDHLPPDYICMEKVVMEKAIEYDNEMVCRHIFQESCHEVTKTIYKPQEVRNFHRYLRILPNSIHFQFEECEEKFKKQCFIEYRNQVFQKDVQICHEPIGRDCNSTSGEIVCEMEYDTGMS